MKNIFIIFKKEIYRFFSDIRLVISIAIIPGLLIYCLYTFVGYKQSQQINSSENTSYIIGVNYSPIGISDFLKDSDMNFEFKVYDDIKTAKEKIASEEAAIYIAFPKDFDELKPSADQNVEMQSELSAAEVKIYYNSLNNSSISAYDYWLSILSSYESSLMNIFDVNTSYDTYDLADSTKKGVSHYAMLLPTFMILFIFVGCTQTVSESIAGEKDRGTLSTVLNTPVRKYELVFGKAVSLSLISMLCGISGFIGAFLSLPRMLNMESNGASLFTYSITDYLNILMIVTSTVFLIVSIIMLISTLSKNTKEAQAYTLPIMFISSAASMSMMFSDSSRELSMFCIPIYNSILCFSDILSLDYSIPFLCVTTAVNLICALAVYAVVTKLLTLESVVFPKS